MYDKAAFRIRIFRSVPDPLFEKAWLQTQSKHQDLEKDENRPIDLLFWDFIEQSYKQNETFSYIMYFFLKVSNIDSQKNWLFF